MKNQELNYDKFANTVLYLLERSAPNSPGSTVLLKMLWHADYWHYRKHLRTITGGQYVAMERGPVLDGYKSLFERLEGQSAVERRDVPVYGKSKAKVEYHARMEPSEDALTEAERETLDEVIRECAHQSGNALSERTHREGPWMMVYPIAPNKPIPYSLFRWLDNVPTESDLEKAKQALDRPACQAALAELSGGLAAA
jgi:uncharacterized phage-associated protein